MLSCVLIFVGLGLEFGEDAFAFIFKRLKLIHRFGLALYFPTLDSDRMQGFQRAPDGRDFVFDAGQIGSNHVASVRACNNVMPLPCWASLLIQAPTS